jgi:hypothetical protein
MQTSLLLSVGGCPPLSARGCSQTLEVTNQTPMKRTLDGVLVPLREKPIKKYRSVIMCQDKEPFAFGSLSQGQIIEVGCLAVLWQKVDREVVELERKPVEGSVGVFDEQKRKIPFQRGDREHVITLQGLQPNRTLWGGEFVQYRPWLTMRITHFIWETKEWEGYVTWKLSLEEV